jgi:hypothetical protein
MCLGHMGVLFGYGGKDEWTMWAWKKVQFIKCGLV